MIFSHLHKYRKWKMLKILFLIHDLGPGGAEKVLVSLVNNMDFGQFDITVMSIFDEGVNRQFLSPKITYKSCFGKAIPGNSHLMKLLSPRALHRWLIKERYDVEVAYLEGPCARILSGCEDSNTKKVAWIHSTTGSEQTARVGFRSITEAKRCYGKMDAMVFVSKSVETAFVRHIPVSGPKYVRYNTNETAKILKKMREPVPDMEFAPGTFTICAVGKLTPNKGFERLIRIHDRLIRSGYQMRTLILGEGPERGGLENLIRENDLEASVKLLGYQTNPYKYVAKCDLFVCASYAEGFSTAATEALIVGTPVCTVEVSGMKEMLGENNEWGIVTENDENALYEGIKRLLDDPALLAHYREKAAERGRTFSTENTVSAVQEMLNAL